MLTADNESSCKESYGARYLLDKYGYKSDIKNAVVQFIKEEYTGDDYRIEMNKKAIKVYGNTPIAFNSAVGKILRSEETEINGYKCHFDNEIRGTYFANHFFNFYHKAPLNEICEYIETLALWGQSVIQLWFDMHHFSSLNDENAREMLKRMKVIFKKGKELGMKTSLTRVSNEYYNVGENINLAQNSLDNGLYKLKLSGYYYTEICPSKPNGRQMIVSCMKELLSELSEIGLDYLCLWPYDQGGCTCENCYPWGGNGFYKISKELALTAKKIFPEIKIICSLWFFDVFTKGEWDAFIDIAKNDENWFDFVMVNICDPISVRIRELDIPIISFPEVSMQGAVPWGGFGANPLPEALSKQFALSNEYCNGGIVYSEGIYDDINKIISLELFRDSSRNVDEILHDYCSFYFGKEYSQELAELIKLLEPTLYRGRFETDGSRNDYPFNEQKELPVFRFDNPENIGKIRDLFLSIDEKLPDYVKNDWRYKILYIRAIGDFELYKNNGVPNGKTDTIYGCLEKIYYGEEAYYFLAPFTRKSALENRGHI